MTDYPENPFDHNGECLYCDEFGEHHKDCPWVKKTPHYKCPRCGSISFNPTDIKENYCGFCHKFEIN